MSEKILVPVLGESITEATGTLTKINSKDGSIVEWCSFRVIFKKRLRK